ncbi:MAG: archease [Nitrospirota bacterium]
MPSVFRFLEDVALADAAFEATGDSPSELFRAAAQAVIETLADPKTVAATWRRTITREDEDLASLLFDWLSEIVYVKDAQGVVFREAVPVVRQERGRWRLDATLVGAPVDPATQELRADVKGVTKHLYELKQDGTRWTARVVLDI